MGEAYRNKSKNQRSRIKGAGNMDLEGRIEEEEE